MILRAATPAYLSPKQFICTRILFAKIFIISTIAGNKYHKKTSIRYNIP